jgi:alpha-L-rhamnosidase
MRRREFLQRGAATAVGAAAAGGLPSSAWARAEASPRRAAAFAWPAVSAQTRPWTRWWWLGAAVSDAGLRQHLTAYRDAGLGGVEIQTIYGATGEEARYRPFLGEAWVAAVDSTLTSARELGLGVDLTTGSGWPFGGPWVTDADAAAALKVEHWDLADGARLGVPVRSSAQPAAALSALVARGPGGQTVDLTASIGADGTLDWSAPTGSWRLTAAFDGRVGMKVKRAAPGSEGLVIDYFSPDALPNYLAPFDQALSGGHGGGLRAMFHDSYEVSGANWTGTILEDFRDRRGYDLRERLPELSGEGDPDTVARVRCDVNETFSDLLLERFTARWSDWSRQHGWISRNQAHGSPANLLDLYGRVDIPETETFGPSAFPIPGLRVDATYPAASSGRPDPLVMRFASSAAHVTGKPLASSESATWLAEHFTGSLSQIKPEIDQLFATGVNHVFFHGAPYSEADEPWPGLLFYASTDLTQANPIWRDLPQLTGYITRAQSVLQAGTHGNDVLVYFSLHDLWQGPDGTLVPQFTVHGAEQWLHQHPTGFGDVAGQLQRDGWQFDFVSDRQLAQARGGRDGVQTAGGRYATVVVPGARLMPLETLVQLRTLAQGGATIIFRGSLPEDVPGLSDLEGRRAQLRALLAQVTAMSAPTAGGMAHAVGRGRFVVADDLAAALADAGARREPMADAGLRVLRRVHDDGHHLFVANLGARAVEGWMALGVDARCVVVLDPLADRYGVAPLRRAGDAPQVRLRLAPGESLILRTFARRTIRGPAWVPVDAEHGVALTGRWRLEFLEGGPTLPAARTLTKLVSWTDLGDEEATAFAGTARYTLRFAGPRGALDGWALDLGAVGEAARVRLNGREVPAAWALPLRVAVGDALRRGENVLELEVTNVAANRVRDLERRGVEWMRFYFVDITYHDFDASGWAPMASGLLGPVRLVRQSWR